MASFVICRMSARLLPHTAVALLRGSLALHAMRGAQLTTLLVVISSIHPPCTKGEAMLLIAGPIISRIQAIQATAKVMFAVET